MLSCIYRFELTVNAGCDIPKTPVAVKKDTVLVVTPVTSSSSGPDELAPPASSPISLSEKLIKNLILFGAVSQADMLYSFSAYSPAPLLANTPTGYVALVAAHAS